MAGIDVSAATLDVMRSGGRRARGTAEQFPQHGGPATAAWGGGWPPAGGPVRVVLEATGVYHRAVARGVGGHAPGWR